MSLKLEQLKKSLQQDPFKTLYEHNGVELTPLADFPKLPTFRRQDSPVDKYNGFVIAWWYDKDGKWIGWTPRGTADSYKQKVRKMKSESARAIALRRAGSVAFGHTYGPHGSQVATTFAYDTIYVREIDFISGAEFFRKVLMEANSGQRESANSWINWVRTMTYGNEDKFTAEMLALFNDFEEGKISGNEAKSHLEALIKAKAR